MPTREGAPRTPRGAQYPAELGQARAEQDARDDRRLDVLQVSQERGGETRACHRCPADAALADGDPAVTDPGPGDPGDRNPGETVALKQPRSRSPPMATKPAMGRSAIRPRGEVPQLRHRSQKICAVGAHPATGSTRAVPVHSLRTLSRLPTDRYGSRRPPGPASGCSWQAVSGSRAGYRTPSSSAGPAGSCQMADPAIRPGGWPRSRRAGGRLAGPVRRLGSRGDQRLQVTAPAQPDEVHQVAGLQPGEADLEPALDVRREQHGLAAGGPAFLDEHALLVPFDDQPGHPAGVGPDPVGEAALSRDHPDHDGVPALHGGRINLAAFPYAGAGRQRDPPLTVGAVDGDDLRAGVQNGPGQHPRVTRRPGGLRAAARVRAPARRAGPRAGGPRRRALRPADGPPS